jgi:hypothetical protein
MRDIVVTDAELDLLRRAHEAGRAAKAAQEALHVAPSPMARAVALGRLRASQRGLRAILARLQALSS